MFLPQEIIRKKRNNLNLKNEEIKQFVEGITSNTVTDSQIAALTMAIYFNGLSEEETANLTMAMRDSGNVLSWSDLNGPIVDKHSTGGLGDLVSLILAPVIAACGGYVPMIAGRGLGHTGGTVDKLEAIPGYKTQVDPITFAKIVKEIGVSIIGQSQSLAPADKRIYAVRDVTATTESIELITASILSKKLASGLQTLVMDIKTGNGAFMENLEQSIKLATSIVKIGNYAGCKTSAIITDMSQPLTASIGNALEIKATLDYLCNKENFITKNTRLHEVNLALGIEMLLQAKLAVSAEEAESKFLENLHNGKAAEVFAKMVAQQGGPVDLLENSDKYLKSAPYIKAVYAKKSGTIKRFKVKPLGMAIVALGGGRRSPNDVIDSSVGLTDVVELGSKVDKNVPLAVIHAKDEKSFKEVEGLVVDSIEIDENLISIQPPPLIYKQIS